MNMKRTLLVWLLVLPLYLFAANDYDLVYLRGLSNRELMLKGVDFADNQHRMDSALIYFSVLANRYRRDMSADDKRLCAQAHIYMWSIHFDRDSNFAVQYENLTSAQHIAEEGGFSMPELNLHFGNMYHTMADICSDISAKHKAIDYYRQALRSLLDADERYWRFADVAMTNMAICAHELDDLAVIAEEEKIYRSAKERGDSLIRAYNMYLIEGYLALENRQYQHAAECFECCDHVMSPIDNNMRYYVQTNVCKAEALNALGQRQEALACLQDALDISERYDYKDLKVYLYGQLMNFYEWTGDMKHSIVYMKKRFMLKDSIVNYSQISAIDDAKISYEIHDANNRYQQLQEKNRRNRLVAIAGVVVAGVVVFFLMLIGIKNRQLYRSNKVLYEKNQELLAMDKELSNHRRESSLGEEKKARLKDAILNVMDTSDEIFSFDFSIDTLARLVNSNHKYVSQTINETFGCNFNVFLNKYRVKEACRRLSDVQKYGLYTMDTIANTVGFRSRTSFTTAFKAYTGQTPSEYLRMARQSQAGD